MLEKIRKESYIGIGLLAAYLLLMRFTPLPDIFLAILLGLGLCAIVIGILPEHIYEKIKLLK
ncbi:hypothetical protein LJC63_08150 [Ruminococcaceae bacterium OttesenSCG-928-L11]|nr:hypothetical protein [Ruminococcaceae bacterium OttesenSCG-928-L11]